MFIRIDTRDGLFDINVSQIKYIEYAAADSAIIHLIIPIWTETRSPEDEPGEPITYERFELMGIECVKRLRSFMEGKCDIVLEEDDDAN